MKPTLGPFLFLMFLVSGCGDKSGVSAQEPAAAAAVVVEAKSDGYLYITAPPAMPQSEIDRIVETNPIYQEWIQREATATVLQAQHVAMPSRIIFSDGVSSYPLSPKSGIGMTLLDDREKK